MKLASPRPVAKQTFSTIPVPMVQPNEPAMVAASTVATKPARFACGRRVSKSFECIVRSRKLQFDQERRGLMTSRKRQGDRSLPEAASSGGNAHGRAGTQRAGTLATERRVPGEVRR